MNIYSKKALNSLIESNEDYNDVFVLSGHINQSIVGSSIKIIENKLVELKFSKTVVSKAKLLGVELMENIFKHQSLGTEISPYFHIAITKKGLVMLSGNSISYKDYLVLHKKLNELDLLSKEEIKKRYIGELTDGSISEKGNAGLGLLTIFNRSNDKPKHLLNKVSEDEYYFNMEIYLSSFN